MCVASLVHSLVRHDNGQDLIEYGLLASLIAVVCIGAVAAMGFQINNVLWATVAANF